MFPTNIYSDTGLCSSSVWPSVRIAKIPYTIGNQEKAAYNLPVCIVMDNVIHVYFAGETKLGTRRLQ